MEVMDQLEDWLMLWDSLRRGGWWMRWVVDEVGVDEVGGGWPTEQMGERSSSWG